MSISNLGDNQLVKIDFSTPQSVARSGAVLTNAYVSGGKMINTAGGCKLAKNLNSLFTVGGTIRLRFKNTNTGVDNRRTFMYQKDADNRITIITNETYQRIILGFELAGVEGHYLISSVDPKTTAEYTIVVVPSAGYITCYKNGVLLGNSSAAAMYITAGVYETLCLGDTDSTEPTGEWDICEVYSSQWTAEEVLDAYEKDTYPEIDASRFDIFLPLKSWYNNGTNDVVENKGKGGTVFFGNGVGSNKPTQLYPNGISVTSSQYLTMTSLAVSSSKDFTFFCGYDFTDMTVTTHKILDLGTYSTDGLLISQYGTILSVYWNAAGGSFTVANFFEKGLNTLAISSKGGIVSVYKNGKKVGADTDLSAKAAFNGSYLFYLGRVSAGAIGKILQPTFGFNVSCTARQIRNMHAKFMENLNK